MINKNNLITSRNILYLNSIFYALTIVLFILYEVVVDLFLEGDVAVGAGFALIPFFFFFVFAAVSLTIMSIKIVFKHYKSRKAFIISDNKSLLKVIIIIPLLLWILAFLNLFSL